MFCLQRQLRAVVWRGELTFSCSYLFIIFYTVIRYVNEIYYRKGCIIYQVMFIWVGLAIIISCTNFIRWKQNWTVVAASRYTACTMREVVILHVQWGKLLYCMYNEGSCFTACTMREVVILHVQWGKLLYCMYNEGSWYTACTMREADILHVQWGKLSYCMYNEWSCYTACTMREFVILHVQWGKLLYCMYNEGSCYTACTMMEVVILYV